MEESNKQNNTDKIRTYKSKTRNELKGKLYKCTGYEGCHMVFNRAEHLARHMRKHTGEKPFQCDICLKHFSRLDNLKQHKGNVHSKIRNIASILKTRSSICNDQLIVGTDKTSDLNQPYYQSNPSYGQYINTNNNTILPNTNTIQSLNTYIPGYFKGYHPNLPTDAPGTSMVPPRQSYITTNTTTIIGAALNNNIPKTYHIVNNQVQSNELNKIGINIPRVDYSLDSTYLANSSHIDIISKSAPTQQKLKFSSLSVTHNPASLPLLENILQKKEQSPIPSMMFTNSSFLSQDKLSREMFNHNPHNNPYPTLVKKQMSYPQNNNDTINNSTLNYSVYPYYKTFGNFQVDPNWVAITSPPSVVRPINKPATTIPSLSKDNDINNISSSILFNNSLSSQAMLQQTKTNPALPVQPEKEGIVFAPTIHGEINSSIKISEQQPNENNMNVNKNRFTNSPHNNLLPFQPMMYQEGQPYYQVQPTILYIPNQSSTDILNINNKSFAIDTGFSNLTINNVNSNLNDTKNRIYGLQRGFIENGVMNSSTTSFDSKSTLTSISSSSQVSPVISCNTNKGYDDLSIVKNNSFEKCSHKRRLPEASSSSSENSNNSYSSGSSDYNGSSNSSSSSDTASDTNESNSLYIENIIQKVGDENNSKDKKYNRRKITSKKSKKKNNNKSNSKLKPKSKPHKKRSKRKCNNLYDTPGSSKNESLSGLESSDNETHDLTTKMKTKKRNNVKTKGRKKGDKPKEALKDRKEVQEKQKSDSTANGLSSSRLSLDYILSHK